MTVSSIFIKLLPVPDKNIFQVGTNCEAIYSQDGKYFPCLIENIEGDIYHVKYKKYNNKTKTMNTVKVPPRASQDPWAPRDRS